MISSIPILGFLAGSALTALHLGLLLWGCWCWACGPFHKESPGIKLALMIIAAAFIPGFLFLLLISLGRFDRVFASAGLAAVALAAHGLWGRSALSELHRIHLQWSPKIRQGSLPVAVLSVAVGIVMLIRLARGLIAPPLAWDALTYHLLKAGRWVQTGGWVWDNAPDSWQFYEWFPPLGDVYWAWTMLGTHTDAWLAVAGVLIWMASGFGVWVTARVLGGDRPSCSLVALAALASPPLLAMLTAAYVDSTAMAITMNGTALLIAAATDKKPQLAAAGTLAMALAVGIKITLLPFLLVGFGTFAYLTFTLKPLQTLKFGVLLVPAVLAALTWQGVLIAHGKTPFFPAAMKFGGYLIEPGNAEFIKHHYHSKYHIPYIWELPRSFWRFLFETEFYSPNHLNFTWTFPVVVFLGSWGAWRTLQSSTVLTRLVLSGLYAAGFLLFVTFWTPSTEVYRRTWLSNMGRFMLPYYGLLIALVPRCGWRWRLPVMITVILINLWNAWPRAWVRLDWEATALGLLLITISVALVWLLQKQKAVLKMAAIILFLGLFTCTCLARNMYRWSFYNNTDHVYDTIYLGGNKFPGRAAQLLNQQNGATINFAADYGGIGYRWFRYVFLGSRLQNRVVYVSPTSDGTVWSKSVTPAKAIDYHSWHRRLIEKRVNYIVTIKPFATELTWIPEHPADFSLWLQDPQGEWAIWKVNQEGDLSESR